MRDYIKPIDFDKGVVDMTHGAGGQAMSQLIDELFVKSFDNPYLNQKEDQASFDSVRGKMVIATDSHVITPLFFPGGDIGSLSVHGTVNDVAMSGATPLYLTAGFILEEGFPLADLRKIVLSMASAAREAGVQIVTGDTKVVEKGKADGVFINTTGVGIVPEGLDLSASRVRPGDKILINGSIGDHGVSIMAFRENLTFQSSLKSDSAALHKLVAKMVKAVPEIRCMRDPTRGGLAATLNEIARQSEVGMKVWEEQIPVAEEVKAACEFLGLDPLFIANEGKVVVFAPPEKAEQLLAVMKRDPLGKSAAIIGEVQEDPDGFLEMETLFGGNRLIDWPTGEPLPRIC